MFSGKGLVHPEDTRNQNERKEDTSIRKIIPTALKKVMTSQNQTVSLSQGKERNINTKCLIQIVMRIVAVTLVKDTGSERSINTGEMTLIVKVVIQTIAVEVRERGEKEERRKENIKRENIKNMMKVLPILNLNELTLKAPPIICSRRQIPIELRFQKYQIWHNIS